MYSYVFYVILIQSHKKSRVKYIFFDKWCHFIGLLGLFSVKIPSIIDPEPIKFTNLRTNNMKIPKILIKLKLIILIYLMSTSTAVALQFDYEKHHNIIMSSFLLLLMVVILAGSNLKIKLLELTQAYDEISAMEEKLTRLAYYDSLTGLYNKNNLEKELTAIIEEAKANSTKVAIIFLDLDNFKTFNDAYGHQVGDLLLKAVADRLDSVTEEDICIARSGGDEFIVCVANITDLRPVTYLAKKIRNLFDKSFIVESKEVFISASMGIAVYPDDGDNVQTLFSNADATMYETKKKGKNHHRYFTQSIHDNMAKTFSLGSSLHNALEQDQLELHYQPQVDIHTERIVGLEALLRWKHPEKGYISPAEFIPVAEECGLIIPIGHWVLQNACTQAKTWREQGLHIPVSINLSPYQIQQNKFAATVEKTLKETGCGAEQIKLEITETTAVQNFQATVIVLEQLREIGVEICLDDFGTGYSSLNYLNLLPINQLKIDKSFIDEITQRKNSQTIVKAIIALSHQLKIEVVAEGVESQEQFSLLKGYNCDIVQGYYFYKPLTVVQLERLINIPI